MLLITVIHCAGGGGKAAPPQLRAGEGAREGRDDRGADPAEVPGGMLVLLLMIIV